MDQLLNNHGYCLTSEEMVLKVVYKNTKLYSRFRKKWKSNSLRLNEEYRISRRPLKHEIQSLKIRVDLYAEHENCNIKKNKIYQFIYNDSRFLPAYKLTIKHEISSLKIRVDLYAGKYGMCNNEIRKQYWNIIVEKKFGEILKILNHC